MNGSNLRHPHDAEQLESLRRWLREKDDEIRILRTTIDGLHGEIRSLQNQVAAASMSADQFDRLDDTAQASSRRCRRWSTICTPARG